ncbi:hypothetical protein CLCR_09176 [Cladophialophora carrionii]|uniref:Uncharacterized protein n=1 Tax=Cladophialophora carrionii TaxID=86049 RepID=A0A1C1CRK2_9EURO|nr:hypothetical protein CLCR_09176 [Cladophialophora carrionii]
MPSSQYRHETTGSGSRRGQSVREASGRSGEVRVISYRDAEGVQRVVRLEYRPDVILEERRPRNATAFEEPPQSLSGAYVRRAAAREPASQGRPQYASSSRQPGRSAGRQESPFGVDRVHDASRSSGGATAAARQANVRPVYEERRPRYIDDARRYGHQPSYQPSGREQHPDHRPARRQEKEGY